VTRGSGYRVRLTPFAREQLKQEMAWSRRHWGQAHQQAFRRSLLARLEAVAAAPHVAAERKELGPGVRLVRHGDLHIAYLVDEANAQVQVVGFPNVHRELGRSVAESLAERLQEGADGPPGDGDGTTG
jgi:plasmid stabilization system protein ParE